MSNIRIYIHINKEEFLYPLKFRSPFKLFILNYVKIFI